MSSVVGESTCKNCKTLIRKISEHVNDPGRWYHIDGHRARIECKGLVAEPETYTVTDFEGNKIADVPKSSGAEEAK